jgi:hypothetical protein
MADVEDQTENGERLPAAVQAGLPPWVQAVPALAGNNILRAAKFLLGKGMSYSNVLSQRHRDNEARAIVSRAVANDLASKIGTDDPMAKRAHDHFYERIVQDQHNVDDIVSAAFEDLAGKPPSSFKEGEISDDWLRHFEDVAKKFSSDAAKARMAKALSGELQRPGSFTFRGISALANLDPQAALALKHFGACAISSLVLDTPRVLTLGKEIGNNDLKEFNLNYAAFETLQEHGLLTHTFTSYQAVFFPDKIGLPFRVGGKKFSLRGAPISGEFPYLFRFAGASMTSVGAEVYSILDSEVCEPYFQLLIQYLTTNQLTVHALADNFDVGT